MTGRPQKPSAELSRPRAAKYARITVEVTDVLLTALEAEAKREQRSRVVMARVLLAEALEARKRARRGG